MSEFQFAWLVQRVFDLDSAVLVTESPQNTAVTAGVMHARLVEGLVRIMRDDRNF